MTNSNYRLPSWVCTMCGTGFTRRTSAKRHNLKLHDGKATLQRGMEYSIERLKKDVQKQMDEELVCPHCNKRFVR